MKKTIAFVCAISMVLGSLAGCGPSKQTGNDSSAEELMKLDFMQYKDSEEIPSWTGDKVKLSVWVDTSAPNSYMEKKKTTKEDVVTPEIERITGVSYDYDKSFDNGGSSFENKVSQMVASNTFPAAATRLPEMTDLVNNNLLYRLDELVKEYAPNLYKLIGPESEACGAYWRQQMEELGGVYQISMGTVLSNIREYAETCDQYSNLTEEQLNWASGAGDSVYPYFWVRDDVLKKIYPQAHTAKELSDIYEKNGSFTEDEIFDVPLSSSDDVINFMYKIKDTLKEMGENESYAFYTHTGADNWPILTVFGNVFQYNAGKGANYFSYYDLDDQECKYTFKEPWFKDLLKTYNKLIIDGVASEEALIDTEAQFNEKIDNYKYAITYNKKLPDDNTVNNGKKAVYRKVFCKYKVNTDKYLHAKSSNFGNNGWSFFTKGISEDDLKIVIRCMDFMVSDAGQKLTWWGPKSAGLYTEDENGFLQFKDEKLYRKHVLGENVEVPQYGFSGGSFPGRIYIDASKYHPTLFYNTFSTWEANYDAALIESVHNKNSNSPNIYSSEYTSAIPEAKNFWNSRQKFESALLKCFAAQNDSEFEANYNDCINEAAKNGLTDETLAKFNDLFKNKVNKDYMQNLTK